MAKGKSWIRPSFVKIYTGTYAEEELDGIVAFYRSPAEQSYLRNMPSVARRSTAIGQQVFIDMMPEIKRICEDMGPNLCTRR